MFKKNNIWLLPYYNKKDYEIDFENNRLLLYPATYEKIKSKGFKKIGGSTIGYVIDKEKFGQNFKAWCHVFRLTEPMLDTKYVDAGVAIEPKIHAYLENHYQSEIKTYPASEYNWDAFKDVEIFGGLPDGVDHQNKILFEIKTTGSKSRSEWKKWNKRIVPDGYYYQASLYTYLLGFKNFKIAVGYLEEDDYKNPSQVSFSTDEEYAKNYLEIFNFELDDKFEKTLEQVKSWYKETTSFEFNGQGDHYKISVEFDPKYNESLIEYLKCETYAQRKALIDRRLKEIELKNIELNK